MGPFYADSSFLVSLHSNDANADQARHFMIRHPEVLPFNPLHRLEVFNGLRLAVFRGAMTRDDRAIALRQIDDDLGDGLLVHQAMPWTEALRKAEQLSVLHAEQLGSRSADTLHVAAALLAGAKRFLSFDFKQRRLAEAAGLEIGPRGLAK